MPLLLFLKMIQKDNVNENLTILQRKDGLLFGTDALLLASFVRPNQNAKAVEFGGGSGIISLLCAKKEFFKHIYTVELQEEYCSLINENIKENTLEGQITLINADVRRLNQKNFGGEVDIVFTNPPYMKKGGGISSPYPLRQASRTEECGNIFDFCAAASRILRSGGLFYTVYRPERIAYLISAMNQNRLELKRLVTVYPMPESEPCLILAEAKKDASESVYFTRPFVLKKFDGSDTCEMKYMLEKGVFPDEYKDGRRKKQN